MRCIPSVWKQINTYITSHVASMCYICQSTTESNIIMKDMCWMVWTSSTRFVWKWVDICLDITLCFTVSTKKTAPPENRRTLGPSEDEDTDAEVDDAIDPEFEGPSILWSTRWNYGKYSFFSCCGFDSTPGSLCFSGTCVHGPSMGALVVSLSKPCYHIALNIMQHILSRDVLWGIIQSL